MVTVEPHPLGSKYVLNASGQEIALLELVTAQTLTWYRELSARMGAEC